MDKKIKILQKENAVLDKQLTKQNNEIITNMIIYLRFSNISDYDMEIIIRDLHLLAIDTQEKNLELKEVIGEDYKAYCDDILSKANRMTRKQSIFYKLSILTTCFYALLFIFFGLGLFKNYSTYNNLNNVIITTADVASFFVIILGGVLIYIFLSKAAFVKRIVQNIVFYSIVVFIFLISAYFNEYYSDVLFSINVFVSFLIVLGLFLVTKLLEKNI